MAVLRACRRSMWPGEHAGLSLSVRGFVAAPKWKIRYQWPSQKGRVTGGRRPNYRDTVRRRLPYVYVTSDSEAETMTRKLGFIVGMKPGGDWNHTFTESEGSK